MTWHCAVFLLAAGSAFAQQLPRQPHGVPARSTPGDYRTHIQVNGITYAASVIPQSEVKRIFAFDISKNYVVFEVAVYPGNANAVLDPDGFVVRVPRSLDLERSADSMTVASVVQQENLPKPPPRVGPVSASTEVGYESETDPYSGRRVHGTYTDTQVGITAGGDPGPPPLPGPGGYPQDRRLLENQLWDKSLPAGQIRRPTAGYLYFPVSLIKKKSNGLYQLQYLAPQDSNSSQIVAPQKVELSVPVKNK